MPELPEVETIRAGLERKLVGRTIEEAEILDERLTRPFDPAAVAAELAGERIAALERRGKYLVVRFESGRVLLIHLRMTGGLRHAPRGKLAEDPYRRAVVRLDDGSDVGYRDIRRFGTWLLLDPGELDEYLDLPSAALRARRQCQCPRRAAAAHRGAGPASRQELRERPSGVGSPRGTRRITRPRPRGTPAYVVTLRARASTGSEKATRAPPSGGPLVASSEPPCARTSAATMASPSPAPPPSR